MGNLDYERLYRDAMAALGKSSGENADLHRQVADAKSHVQYALDWLEVARGGLSYTVVFADIDRARKELQQAFKEATDETD